jgi:hypothetical protein
LRHRPREALLLGTHAEGYLAAVPLVLSPVKAAAPHGDLPLSGWAELNEFAGGEVIAGDPPVPVVRGRVAMVLTSPPYGRTMHGRVEHRRGPLTKFANRYGEPDPAGRDSQSPQYGPPMPFVDSD